ARGRTPACDAAHKEAAPAHVLDPVVLDHEAAKPADDRSGRVDLDPAAASRVLIEVAADVVDVEVADGQVTCRLAGGDQMDAAPLAGAVSGVDDLEALDRCMRDVLEPDAVLGARGDQRRPAAAIGADQGLSHLRSGAG